ncbi:hypothetical protein [Streptomyces sp. GMR22]|uniref:hypothetical protein n=1 Tax=Streptomyces sp. GMR22 TaxID=2759524 RepID=UPI003FA3BCBE
MALVRKGSRRIVVDGTAYRWRLRRRPTYLQGLAWSPCTFAVEHAEAPGTTLVVTTSQPHPSNWLGREAKPVRPADVAEAIELALGTGWDPEAPGRPFHLDLSLARCCRAGPGPSQQQRGQPGYRLFRVANSEG